MILLQATSGTSWDSQIIGALMGAFLVLLGGAIAHLYAKTGSHGERLTRVEVAQEWYMRSTEQNRREVVTPNPLTPTEKAVLDFITGKGGDRATLDELEIARKACFRESVDPDKTPGAREKYKNLLPVLDTRWALKKYDEERKQLPWWRRFLDSLR